MYVEQLTYLLFLKIVGERTQAPYVPAPHNSAHASNQVSIVPGQWGWQTLLKEDGDELYDLYRHTPETLGGEKGMPGLIFNRN